MRGRGEGGKEEEGSSQGACVNDPGTWTTAWGLTVGAGSWGALGRAVESNRATVRTTVIEQ